MIRKLEVLKNEFILNGKCKLVHFKNIHVLERFGSEEIKFFKMGRIIYCAWKDHLKSDLDHVPDKYIYGATSIKSV